MARRFGLLPPLDDRSGWGADAWALEDALACRGDLERDGRPGFGVPDLALALRGVDLSFP